jgi:hypothetical protein
MIMAARSIDFFGKLAASLCAKTEAPSQGGDKLRASETGS